ncbi:MAG: hypothetical protein MI747_15460 [Desulfobacterales bacterium]|nr:hypothetical protein [Desulfobacterales bacterium]
MLGRIIVLLMMGMFWICQPVFGEARPFYMGVNGGPTLVVLPQWEIFHEVDGNYLPIGGPFFRGDDELTGPGLGMVLGYDGPGPFFVEARLGWVKAHGRYGQVIANDSANNFRITYFDGNNGLHLWAGNTVDGELNTRISQGEAALDLGFALNTGLGSVKLTAGPLWGHLDREYDSSFLHPLNVVYSQDEALDSEYLGVRLGVKARWAVRPAWDLALAGGMALVEMEGRYQGVGYLDGVFNGKDSVRDRQTTWRGDLGVSLSHAYAPGIEFILGADLVWYKDIPRVVQPTGSRHYNNFVPVQLAFESARIWKVTGEIRFYF